MWAARPWVTCSGDSGRSRRQRSMQQMNNCSCVVTFRSTTKSFPACFSAFLESSSVEFTQIFFFFCLFTQTLFFAAEVEGTEVVLCVEAEPSKKDKKEMLKNQKIYNIYAKTRLLGTF